MKRLTAIARYIRGWAAMLVLGLGALLPVLAAVLTLWLGVASLQPAAAQSVVNTLSRPPATATTPPQQQVASYAPVTPPAQNVPTVVAPNQATVAKELEMLPGETNEAYTRRMKLRNDAAMRALERAGAEHQARMQALLRR